MNINVKKQQYQYYFKRFLPPFFLAVVSLVLFVWGILYFYAVDSNFSTGLLNYETRTIIFGIFIGVGLSSIVTFPIWAIARLPDLLLVSSRTKKTILQYYTPKDPSEDLYQVLQKDMRRQIADCVFIGTDWLVVGSSVIKRSAIVGIFTQPPWRKQSRLYVVDDCGRTIYTTFSIKRFPRLLEFLAQRHLEATTGTSHLLLEAQMKARKLPPEQKETVYRAMRKQVDYPMGMSPYDRQPIVEDNLVCCDYERWLMVAQSLYWEDVGGFDGDLCYLGASARSEYQKNYYRYVLKHSWDTTDKAELLHNIWVRISSKSDFPGWQLSRAAMLLSFGYMSEFITRKEVLHYGFYVGTAIQQKFHNWTELFDSFMEGYAAWAHKVNRPHSELVGRTKAYERLKKKLGTVLNTPFDLPLQPAFEQAMRMLAQVPQQAEPVQTTPNAPQADTYGSILLTQTLQPQVIADAISKVFGKNAVGEMDQSDSVTHIPVALDGVEFLCSYLPFPLPEEEQDIVAFASNAQKPSIIEDAEDTPYNHRAFLLVVQKGGAADLVTKRRICRLFSRLCRTLLELQDAVAYYQNQSGVLRSKENYVELSDQFAAVETPELEFALPLFLSILPVKSPSGFSMRTFGLKEFGFPDICFYTPNGDQGELRLRLYWMASCLLTGSAVYNDMDTISFGPDSLCWISRIGDILFVFGVEG